MTGFQKDLEIGLSLNPNWIQKKKNSALESARLLDINTLLKVKYPPFNFVFYFILF
jgi:hypothetical protein